MTTTNELTQDELDQFGVQIERWGKDHWSTLAYIESICVDSMNGVGRVGRCKVQTNIDRHPEYAHMSVTPVGSQLDGAKFGIRLADSTLPGPAYDEWDCIEDFENNFLVVDVGFTSEPAYRMTRLGNLVAGKVRAHWACSGGNYADIRVTPAEIETMKKQVAQEEADEEE